MRKVNRIICLIPYSIASMKFLKLKIKKLKILKIIYLSRINKLIKKEKSVLHL